MFNGWASHRDTDCQRYKVTNYSWYCNLVAFQSTCKNNCCNFSFISQRGTGCWFRLGCNWFYYNDIIGFPLFLPTAIQLLTSRGRTAPLQHQPTASHFTLTGGYSTITVKALLKHNTIQPTFTPLLYRLKHKRDQPNPHGIKLTHVPITSRAVRWDGEKRCISGRQIDSHHPLMYNESIGCAGALGGL